MEIDKGAYLEEAAELLAELETALLELEDTPDDHDLVDRVFRAMHTIKGSGAMYGFDAVAEFTHEVETVFDKVREGVVPVSTELINLTLAARDQIRMLLDSETGGPPADLDNGREIIAGLQNLMGDSPAGPNREPSTPAPPQEQIGAGNSVTYRIRFHPHPGLFATGTNPLLLLDELRDLGETSVVAHTEKIPTLDQYDPESCYVYWDVILTTDQGRQAIEDVFIFVEDDCRIDIDVIDEEGIDDEEDYKRLGEILVDKGEIDNDELMRILASQKRIGEVLIEAEVVDADKVAAALVEQQHVRRNREKRREKLKEGSAIRVASERLDKLVDLVGELVIVQARLTQKAGSSEDSELLMIAEEVERLIEELRDSTMSIRMLPIGTLFTKFKRLVRDLSKELGKEVEMIVEGAETELDKTVIDRLNDPLVHLIRNSIDHGVEPPAVRAAAGKPKQGVVRLTAEHSGANVLIRIEDDGAGLDPEVLRKKAVEKGLISPDADLADQELYQLIFAAGFSTASKVTDVSGRGVGMDVVKRSIDSLGGTILIDSEKGRGMAITLKLPLTLAIIDGLLVRIGDGFFVMPLAVVDECIEINREEAARARERNMINFRDEMCAYVSLREQFHINGGQPDIEHVVIVKARDQRVGFGIDRVIGQHQTVIKSLTKVYRDIPGLSGATILGDGTVALILDVNMLLAAAEQQGMERERVCVPPGTAHGRLEMHDKTITEAGLYLTFRLGDELFAIDVNRVREVLEIDAITVVPNAPDFMRGIINVRGSVVPVIDLRAKFGMSPTEKTVHTRVVVMELDLDGELTVVGAMADSVHEVIELTPEVIEPPPRIGSRWRTRFVKGVGKRDEQFILILDIDKVFSHEELTRIESPVEEEGKEAV